MHTTDTLMQPIIYTSCNFLPTLLKYCDISWSHNYYYKRITQYEIENFVFLLTVILLM